MEMPLRYARESAIESGDERDVVRLFPNLLRDALVLDARVRDVVAFRDAMLAMRACVVSELHVDLDEIVARRLDPVITVTPDRVFLEAFSLDESSYARITLRSEALDDVRALAPGCTNVEFSDGLVTGLRGLRGSRPVTVAVEPAGFGLASAGSAVVERKVELPESWLDGFVNVQAALRLPAVSLDAHPGDLANVLAYLKRRRATTSPRSLRLRLSPGEAPVAVLEPWNDEIVLRRTRFEGAEPAEVRVWGRRRLLLLDKVLASARRVRVLLPGTGMPSFWVCELGSMSFALGISPWAAREWTGPAPARPAAGRTDASRDDVDRALAYAAGKSFVFTDELADVLGLSAAGADAVLDRLCLDGRALFDVETGAAFLRELFPGRVA